jgi:hypothetical protein
MIEKFEAVLGRGYISPGPVLSLTAFFGVPKGVGQSFMMELGWG